VLDYLITSEVLPPNSFQWSKKMIVRWCQVGWVWEMGYRRLSKRSNHFTSFETGMELGVTVWARAHSSPGEVVLFSVSLSVCINNIHSTSMANSNMFSNVINMILRSSLINFLTSSLFPGLTAEDGLPFLRLYWRLLQLRSSTPTGL